MADLHPLAQKYVEALDAVPEGLRARRALEDQVGAALVNHSVCIRGFSRIGKTELMKSALRQACKRTGGAALVIDLADEIEGMKTWAEVKAQIAARVSDFLKRVGAADVKVDPARPLFALGELEAPLFVGLDSLTALEALGAAGMEAALSELLEVPRNVKLALVCQRHQAVDALFEALVVAHPKVKTFTVSGLEPAELETLLREPAKAAGIEFPIETVETVGALTGNRPWEALCLALAVTQALPPGHKGALPPNALEPLVSLDALTEHDAGQAVVDNLLHVYATAMNAEERTVMEMLATGAEGEATEDAVQRLVASGWVQNADGFSIRSSLMEALVSAVVDGSIKVSVGN